ncbi:cation:proton antiporter [Streptomyces sp. PTM05]|uniref:Cation:proton antiporter n=1 Tax=Streptantibioticus parmotrematis TaxID=2873249 RepID=A0ABS7QQI1_9ACTN|nr:cation:proton antiporter [Streptantibioticus parmotrematis]MBY8885456.1 cation:proton antiporter [Streptantibioticus parmotrematis]
MSATSLAPAFLAAAIVVLLVCRLVAWAVSRTGQPPVVGEMIAGVLLGPSVLGALAPRVEHAVFPTALMPLLYVAGQIGLVAFMFQAGHEFAGRLGERMAGTAAAVSAVGVTLPLALGVGVTVLAHGHAPVFAPGVSLGVSAAFVGVALAITAFPMLARIITERGLSGTRYGALALASGALDDVVAWCLLAAVLSAATGRTWPVAEAVGGGVVFAVLVFTVVRRGLARAMAHPSLPDEGRLLLVVVTVFAAAWFTDKIGLYAVFGAFCVGVVMPRGPVAERTVSTVSHVPRVVFLPMFFAYSGLNTRFGLLGDPALLAFAAAALAAAVLGKFGGCWAAARLRGEPPALALRLGTLMNARGLMQLIALNAGLQDGIVNRQLFAALVLVALVTTLMTTPVLSWLDRRSPMEAASHPPAALPRVVEGQPEGRVGPGLHG